MYKKFKCSNCGEETDGTYSEGGILMSLCERCYKELYDVEEY